MPPIPEREIPMQAIGLQGERLLVVEDQWLIATGLRATLEHESATVVLASSLPEALLCATEPALSGAVVDFRLGNDHAEPVCEALNRRNVPFIFFTGLARLPERWAATPIVHKPAAPETIVGALKFILSPDTRETIVKSQRSDDDIARLARIDHAISEAEERMAAMRRCIVRLFNSGADTSVAEQTVARTIELIESMRMHRQILVRIASKSAR